LDAIAKIVWVHRVKFPTTVTIVGTEPSVARVLALIGCGERRQRGHMFSRQCNSSERYVIAAIVGEPGGQIRFRHEHAARIKVTDIQHDQFPAVVVLGNVVDGGGTGETVHHTKAYGIFIEHRSEHAAYGALF